MRIWQKTPLNLSASFYDIGIPFQQIAKPTEFLQPSYSHLSFYHTLKSSNESSHTCISPLSINLTYSTGSSIASASIRPWEFGVVRRPLSHFPTIQTYDAVGIIVNDIHRVILLVVKSSCHSHDQPPAFRTASLLPYPPDCFPVPR